ncbi:sirohydrochlorin chelatase [Litchfieldia salsa]|uniref:Sirohydrochlorin ferrochelatase n=1 Tax=Litchfieldia salsa TaxID=930152 RepID=A0A1H0WKI7_9BACI|nr:sirohydrochlorin chelatase [Litchfieldia salsa]SDP91229.1 sirohydrochlorin ferrochelatase [Litchfieldia salsa]
MEALIYASHGSRTESGNTQFLNFVKEMMPIVKVPLQSFGFLEGIKPSIFEAISTAIFQGATSVTIMPVLLLTGSFASKDMPAEITKAKEMFPTIPFYYGQPFGYDEILIQILNDRLEKKMHNNRKFKAVLLVSHGSYDENAHDQFEEIAQKLRFNKPFDVFTCYLNMAKPSLENELENILNQPYEEVYIVPYLLYSGGFTIEIENITSKYQESYLDKNVILCELVGFDDKLKDLFLRRITEVQPLV